MGQGGLRIVGHRRLWIVSGSPEQGAHIIFEQTRLNTEVWLLKRIEVKYDVRLALFKHQSGEFEQVHSNFRKFQADSKIVPSDEQ
jgi:hypothetical protein